MKTIATKKIKLAVSKADLSHPLALSLLFSVFVLVSTVLHAQTATPAQTSTPAQSQSAAKPSDNTVDYLYADSSQSTNPLTGTSACHADGSCYPNSASNERSINTNKSPRAKMCDYLDCSVEVISDDKGKAK